MKAKNEIYTKMSGSGGKCFGIFNKIKNEKKNQVKNKSTPARIEQQTLTAFTISCNNNHHQRVFTIIPSKLLEYLKF